MNNPNAMGFIKPEVLSFKNPAMNNSLQLTCIVGPSTASTHRLYQDLKKHKLHAMENDCMIEHILRYMTPKQIYSRAISIDKAQDYEMKTLSSQIAEGKD